MPEILYHHKSLVVINKPAGVLTQAPPGIDSMELRVRQWRETCHDATRPIYVGVPHRLDRPASGAMVMGLSRKVTRGLSKQFEQRRIQKTYWVWVAGDVQPDAGCWRDTMRKVPGEARAEIVTADHKDAKSAVLHYQVLERRELAGQTFSSINVQLETGRTHQIRLQASCRNHPVWGDLQYGSTMPFGEPTEDVRAAAIALHSRTIEFEHPKTHERIAITAPTPNQWPAST